MGIDVYLRWDKQTKEEHDKQITGYDITKGDVGYLREAYHGSVYATEVLMSEDWDKQGEGLVIKNSVLKSRLSDTIKTVIERHKTTYSEILTEDSPYVKSFVNFVDLHGKLEKENRNPRIVISY